jgi:hypothetical protein
VLLAAGSSLELLYALRGSSRHISDQQANGTLKGINYLQLLSFVALAGKCMIWEGNKAMSRTGVQAAYIKSNCGMHIHNIAS